MTPLDETHDPALRSWVESANRPDADFPIQNLPLGVFQHTAAGPGPRIGVAIGDSVLDLAAALEDVPEPVREACHSEDLSALMALGGGAWKSLRLALSRMLRAGANITRTAEALRPASECRLLLPCLIREFTDFYASIDHAANVGAIFRPGNPLLPNYKHLPLAYHGRASSIVPSSTPIRRPRGQWNIDDRVVFGPTRKLDYECEAGCLVASGNALGEPIPIAEAEEHIFGFCLVNDWSARDIQRWEYQPLGPFLGKSFATSISPWIVTMEALRPFRAPRRPRAPEDPGPLPYLDSEQDRAGGSFGITVEVLIRTAAMREQGHAPVRLSRASLDRLYWSFAQMIAHHTSNGCNLRRGDLLASGTISGFEADSQGCLLELTSDGARPIELPGGETRTYLEDGDEIELRAWCEREGCARIGFGSCTGVVLPSSWPGVREHLQS